ncbi:MAG: histidine kinase dimerization/phospho-acceptor domain-containing protein, partial [Myxococcota bacterium]|nr:histidine kinase dimerization/phospho-acceptor domain-containing protein [Myxococcota bacterium]
PASAGAAGARSEPKASEVHQDASAPATPPYAGTPASAGAAGARSEPKASEVHQDASAPATPPYAGTPASAGAAGARSEPQASEVHQAGEVQRLAASLAHEIGNPLVGIRTFSALLPEQYGDAEFRRRFAARLSDDTQRIEKAVETLSALAALGTPQPAAVDVSELISAELMRRRGEIEARRLIVLEELERERPHALADPTQLRFALHGLLGRTLALVPERGDLYVATHHRPQGPALRVVLRFRAGEEADGLGVLESSLWLTVAAAVIRAQGGSVTLDAGGDETLVLVELPAPAES